MIKEKYSQLFLIAILGITLMASAIAINIQAVGASSDGQTQGYNDGIDDGRDGKGFNDHCSSSHNVLYCLAYKAGYSLGYAAARSAYD